MLDFSHIPIMRKQVSTQKNRIHHRFTQTFHVTTIITAFVTERCKKKWLPTMKE